MTVPTPVEYRRLQHDQRGPYVLMHSYGVAGNTNLAVIELNRTPAETAALLLRERSLLPTRIDRRLRSIRRIVRRWGNVNVTYRPRTSATDPLQVSPGCRYYPTTRRDHLWSNG